MKTDKNNLQKLTDEKINSILKLSRITLKDIEPLNENETNKLMQIVTEKLLFC
jgi:hypothetical protein